MFFLRFYKGARPRRVVSVGTVLLSLAFVFSQNLIALAQDEAPAVSAEVQTEVEAELSVSPEAAKEFAADLSTELGHPDYDGLVPADGFWGRVAYPLKETAWNLQEGLYDVFASEASHAQLVLDHADLHLLDAAEQITKAPDSLGTAAGILSEYRDDVTTVQDRIDEIKTDDPSLAKALSAEMFEDHGLTSSKVLGSLVDTALQTDPAVASTLMEIKKEVVASAGQSIIAAADNDLEIKEAFFNIATADQVTPFSGFNNATVLSEMKEQLKDGLTQTVTSAIDEVIDLQLQGVERNMANLKEQASDEAVADSFEKYVTQLPGSSIERVKMLDQFKAGMADPLFIEKTKEIQAKVSQAIGEKVRQVIRQTVAWEIKKSIQDAMLSVANPGVEDLRIMNQMRDFMPDPELKKQMDENINSQIVRFRERFADDTKAQAVTNEFESLVNKMKNGNFVPDPAYFKTMEGLYNQLAPEQQEFIAQMEQEGKQQMVNRMQTDPNFVDRFATYNPEDVRIIDQFRVEFRGPDFAPPPGFNFETKFREMEQRQAENFTRYLEFQNRPEAVQAIRQQFENSVPAEIRTRFETQYNFTPEVFQQHEEQASEKQEFFLQIPGAPGFGPGFPPPFVPSPPPGGPERVDVNSGQPRSECPSGTIRGPYGCEFRYERPVIQFSCPPEMVQTPSGCEPIQPGVNQTPPFSSPPPAKSYPTPDSSSPNPLTPEAYSPSNSIAPTGYASHPTVEGVFTRVYSHDLGAFDVLTIFGLGIYAYRRRKKMELEIE